MANRYVFLLPSPSAYVWRILGSCSLGFTGSNAVILVDLYLLMFTCAAFILVFSGSALAWPGFTLPSGLWIPSPVLATAALLRRPGFQAQRKGERRWVLTLYANGFTHLSLHRVGLTLIA